MPNKPLERHLRVQRTARVYQRGTPSAETRELWIACHGYGQLAAPFIDALAPLDDPRRVIVAPEALSRFYLDEPLKPHGPDARLGASWMTREDREHEIADYVAYLDVVAETLRSEIDARDVRVVALGFSQGVATVARWAALGKTAPQSIVLWAGTLPPDLPTDRGDQLFRGAAVTLVAGRSDTLVRVANVEHAQQVLDGRGIQARLLTYDGGHTLNSDLLRQLGAEISNAA